MKEAEITEKFTVIVKKKENMSGACKSWWTHLLIYKCILQNYAVGYPLCQAYYYFKERYDWFV
jgi:hypothetical protein